MFVQRRTNFGDIEANQSTDLEEGNHPLPHLVTQPALGRRWIKKRRKQARTIYEFIGIHGGGIRPGYRRKGQCVNGSGMNR